MILRLTWMKARILTVAHKDLQTFYCPSPSHNLHVTSVTPAARSIICLALCPQVPQPHLNPRSYTPALQPFLNFSFYLECCSNQVATQLMPACPSCLGSNLTFSVKTLYSSECSKPRRALPSLPSSSPTPCFAFCHSSYFRAFCFQSFLYETYQQQTFSKGQV